jgi:hypothetical protein
METGDGDGSVSGLFDGVRSPRRITSSERDADDDDDNAAASRDDLAGDKAMPAGL